MRRLLFFRAAGLAVLPLTCALVSAFQTETPANMDWPFNGNDPGGMRYVNFDQITPSNVTGLAPAWIFHTGVSSENTSFEVQPIIVNGVMYISSPHNHVFALDAATGALKWTYNPELPPLSQLGILGGGPSNRGVAVGAGKVFIGQLDATLVALDTTTGRVVWKVAVDRWQDKWTETMAPLFVDNKVIIGASGGEYMKRGHVSAYDANTGRMIWRFFATPGPGEFGNDTWAGNSWQTGGGAVWTTPVADTQLGLLYITTGNAAPDLNGSQRAGDNLFTASIVALDLNTGLRRWHFQEVHHDLWDYDSAQPAHLFTLERGGQRTPAIGHANKNGFYFILDRRDGKPLFEVREVPVPTEPAWQNAARTQPVPTTEPLIPQAVETVPPGMKAAPFWTPPQETPLLIQPGFESGPEWTPSAYSPRTRIAYIQAGGYEPWIYHSIPPVVNSLGSTAFDAPTGVENYGLFTAMDTTTGRIAWRIRTPEKIVSGVVVAGDLVFFGESNGKFNAVDAKSGNILWSFKSDRAGVGGANASPAVYMVNGREYVVNAFGGNIAIRTGIDISPTGDAVIAFALPRAGQTTASPATVVRATPQPVNTGEIPESAKRGSVASAPADARVIELNAHDLDFHPNTFTAFTGEKLAVRIINSDVMPIGFAVMLPSGPIALKDPVKPGESANFVFEAPTQPGVYDFFSPIGSQKFLGLTGQMRVAPPCAAQTTPCISSAGVVNATDFRTGAVAPGQVVAIFGRGIGPERGESPDLISNPQGRVSDFVGGTQLFFDGVSAPILYAQANQVNAIVPFEVAGRSTAEVQFLRNGQTTTPVTVSLVPARPSVFGTTGTGRGQAVALNPDGSFNSSSNPAARGAVISVFATGIGQTNPPGLNGLFARDDTVRPAMPVSALIGGVGAEVVKAHVPVGIFAGVIQVDVRVPRDARSGPSVPLEIVVGDTISTPDATIAVR